MVRIKKVVTSAVDDLVTHSALAFEKHLAD